MAWLEVHQSLPTHRKTDALADLLGIRPVEVVGHVTCLWLWALDNARDGNLTASSPRAIARAAMWEGDPSRFYNALVAAGFLDEPGMIHDWDEYTGRLQEQLERRREKTRERVANWRARQKALQEQDESGNGLRSALPNGSVTLDVTRGNATTVPNQPDLTNQTARLTTAAASGVRAQAPSLDVERAAVYQHPAVQIVQDLGAPHQLNTAQAAKVANVFKHPTPDQLTRWRQVVVAWLEDGFKPTNVRGMLESYQRAAPRVPTASESVALAPRVLTPEEEAASDQARERARAEVRSRLHKTPPPVPAEAVARPRPADAATRAPVPLRAALPDPATWERQRKEALHQAARTLESRGAHGAA